MKYLKSITLATLALIGATCISGCSSVGKLTTSDLVTPGLVIGGASLGAFAAEGESEGTRLAATAGGGLLGWLASVFITDGVQQEKKDEFRSGYELGQSNATKSLYWNMQSLHEARNQPDSRVIYYQIPADYPQDGANRTPGSVMMPIAHDAK